jgi:hypothetical protein
MEKLDRSPVAVARQDGVYVGWRMLGLDPDGIAFNVYRDGRKINDAPLTGSTNVLDEDGTRMSVYQVATVLDGRERADVPRLVRPVPRHPAGQARRRGDADRRDVHLPRQRRQCDVDGDGTYEIVLK